MVFVETRIFTRLVTAALSDGEYAALQQDFADHPDSGRGRPARRNSKSTEMRKVDFGKLLDSVRQAGEIAGGRRRASRAFKVAPTNIKALRTQTQLSQPDFAALLGVEVSTLRNWEQGRREPTGPAKALLRAIRNDPKNVLRALADAN